MPTPHPRPPPPPERSKKANIRDMSCILVPCDSFLKTRLVLMLAFSGTSLFYLHRSPVFKGFLPFVPRNSKTPM